jgi:SAM-dependent methyltransferase
VPLPREFRIEACLSCGSQYIWPRPTIIELKDFYPSDYHAYNHDHSWLAGMLVKRRDQVRRRLYRKASNSHPIRLFDVGSGDCRQFDALRGTGEFEFSGIEINPRMVGQARSNGYDVYEGTLEEMELGDLAGSFDIVTMYQLVEHVLEPAKLFSQALNLLKPGGVVIGQMPCLDSMEAWLFGRHWAGYHFPRHLQQVTVSGLSKCMREAGLERVVVKSALHLQAAISLQNIIVDRFPPKQRLHFGKIEFYNGLLIAVAPFCIAEFLAGRGGMMNFSAERPQ